MSDHTLGTQIRVIPNSMFLQNKTSMNFIQTKESHATNHCLNTLVETLG